MGEALKNNNSLRTFNLKGTLKTRDRAGNKIGNEGIMAIAESLELNSTLQSLIISRTALYPLSQM